eukprot:scaffold157418_cov18-Tisochrysis_lutea.AAC.1
MPVALKPSTAQLDLIGKALLCLMTIEGSSCFPLPWQLFLLNVWQKVYDYQQGLLVAVDGERRLDKNQGDLLLLALGALGSVQHHLMQSVGGQHELLLSQAA